MPARKKEWMKDQTTAKKRRAQGGRTASDAGSFQWKRAAARPKAVDASRERIQTP